MKKSIYVILGFFALIAAPLTANTFTIDVEKTTKRTEKKGTKASKLSKKKKRRKKNKRKKQKKRRKKIIITGITLTVIGVPLSFFICEKINRYARPSDIDDVFKALNEKTLTIDENKKRNDNTDGNLADYSMYHPIHSNTKSNLIKKYVYKKGEKANRVIGAMYGMAIGDATGAPLEFLGCVENSGKSYFDLKNKIWVREKNNFRLERGQWTDDAAMGLCMADSLIQCGKFDGSDIRIRFWNWWFHGYNNAFRLDKKRKNKTSVGLGGNISKSIHALQKGKKPPPAYKEEKTKDDAGNGSLMRLAPIPIFFCHTDIDTALEYAKKSSFTTHQGLIAAECCALMTYIIIKAIQRENSEKDIKLFLDRVTDDYLKRIEKELKKLPSQDNNREAQAKSYIIRLLKSSEHDGSKERNWNWKNKKGKLGIDKVMKKRGARYNNYPNTEGYFGSYSMDGLAMGLHAVYNSTSFGTAIESAVNLLGDADSTGSIAGQIAGAFYGFRDVMKDTHDEKYLFDYTKKWDDCDIGLRAILLFERGQEAERNS